MDVDLNNLTESGHGAETPFSSGQRLGQEEIAEPLREFIARNFLFSDSGFQYSDEASFLGEGIIDSLGIIELVPFVEKQFGITVGDHELLPNNFDSVTKLTSFIVKKQGKVS